MTHEEKIEDRIRKLIKLAGDNANVNEAATAFAAAQAMATRHDLDLDDLMADAEDEDEGKMHAARAVENIGQGYVCRWNSTTAWRLHLACGVANAHGLATYYRSRSGVVGVGQPSDIQAAARMFNLLEHRIEQMAREAVKAYKANDEIDPRWDASPRVYGRSWRMGCADAVAMRLPMPGEVVDESRKEVEAARVAALNPGAALDEAQMAKANTALVRVDAAADYLKRVDAAVSDYYATKVQPGLGRSSGHRGAGSGDGYSSGRSAGGSMNVSGSTKAIK